MLILGIDPGSRSTGFGVVRARSGNRCEVVDFGRFAVDAAAPLATRLALLLDDLDELLDSVRPSVAAIESTFLGMNPRSLVVLSQARGAILGALGRHGLEIVEYSPAEVKNAVTGNGRAQKDQVERMVKTLLGLPADPLPRDSADALAIAICCAQRRVIETLTPPLTR